MPGTIGILGGMGPEATADLYLRIIRLYQQRYGAAYDSDFPEMIIVNLPIPDVVEDTRKKDKVKGMLAGGVKKLEDAGADFIVIPCNTVTDYIGEIPCSVPLVDIVQETKEAVKDAHVSKIGLLGTETTIESGIYDNAKGDVLTLEKHDRAETTRIIMNILSGRKSGKDKEKLLGFVRKLKDRGADKVILGCTELSLLISAGEDVIDTLDVLAESAVERSESSCWRNPS